jgi:CBS domain containing-hemolysin-like protein
MQSEKQHMRIVIDEYGGVAGIVTIEDLLEAIVGNIADEHDEPEDDDAPIREPSGAYVVSGAFELSRLRELFADQFPSTARAAVSAAGDEDAAAERSSEKGGDRDDATAIRIPEHYESTTVGGLVSELAGHIPLPGEVVEAEGLRLEVLASTDRKIDRIRVSLAE